MPTDYYHKPYVCPFIKSNGKAYVKCEGGSMMIFPNAQIAKEHINIFCCDRWKECSVAIFLNKYYERQENGNQ